MTDINPTPIVTDETIEETLPMPEEIVLEEKPMTEGEAEEAVGGDEPVEGEQNFNIEDEEAEKQESIS
ncbi:MAG: hypothetical protein V4686_03540 [Patescibacteria group bacterium]